MSFNVIQKIFELRHKNLNKLTLNYNNLRELNEKKWLVPKLVYLDVSSNQINNLDLSLFSQYSTLNFSSNPLKEVTFPPNNFPDLGELELHFL